MFPLHISGILHFSDSLPSSLVSCSWPGQVGKALPCVTGAAAEGTAATSASRPDSSRVSGCCWDGKLPPQKDGQGQGLIKFKLDIFHHLLPWVFCLFWGRRIAPQPVISNMLSSRQEPCCSTAATASSTSCSF